MIVRYSPGTLACWESDYRRYGFDALMPKARNDSGKSRKLDDDTMAAIYHIRQQFPKINATLLRYKLIGEGIIQSKDVQEPPA